MQNSSFILCCCLTTTENLCFSFVLLFNNNTKGLFFILLLNNNTKCFSFSPLLILGARGRTKSLKGYLLLFKGELKVSFRLTVGLDHQLLYWFLSIFRLFLRSCFSKVVSFLFRDNPLLEVIEQNLSFSYSLMGISTDTLKVSSNLKECHL